MRSPSRQVVRAVYRNTATFNLPFNFVLSKPVESASLLVNVKAAGVGVEDVSIGVMPSGSRNDPLRCHRCGEPDDVKETSEVHSECSSSGRVV